jgi:Flp pilus assembly protein TadG
MLTPASPRTCHRPGGDTGSASVEIAILGPALLLLVFAIVQGGLWFYAHNLALAAAEEGVTTGAAYGARPDIGVVRTRTFLDQQAGDSLTATTISSAGSTPTVVRIAVTGRSLSVLPGVPGIEVTATAVGPVERFTTDGAP